MYKFELPQAVQTAISKATRFLAVGAIVGGVLAPFAPSVSANELPTATEFPAQIAPLSAQGSWATVSRAVDMTTTSGGEVIRLSVGQIVSWRSTSINGWYQVRVESGNNRGAIGSIHRNNISNWHRN